MSGDTLTAMSSAPISPHLALTLLESGRVTSTSHRLMMAGSITTQVSVVCAIVVGVSAIRLNAPETTTLDERPSFLAPFRQTMPRPIEERLSFAALGGVVAPVVSSTPVVQTPRPITAPVPEASGGDGRTISDERDEMPTKAFTNIEVDSVVVRDSTSAGPDYPPTMLAKGIEGSVLARFVVDTTGRPDLSTFMALEATHPDFSEAVRAALPKMKFRPAIMSGKVVPQLVEQRFGFRVINPVVATPTTPKKPSA